MRQSAFQMVSANYWGTYIYVTQTLKQELIFIRLPCFFAQGFSLIIKKILTWLQKEIIFQFLHTVLNIITRIVRHRVGLFVLIRFVLFCFFVLFFGESTLFIWWARRQYVTNIIRRTWSGVDPVQNPINATENISRRRSRQPSRMGVPLKELSRMKLRRLSREHISNKTGTRQCSGRLEYICWHPVHWCTI